MNLKEAIKTMEHWIEYEKNNKEKINKADELINIQETILNLIEKLQKENETKEKIIDDMADWLYKDDTSFGYGKLKEVNTKERIVKFFENKTEQKQ